MSQGTEKELLTVKQLARRFGVSRMTIYRWRKEPGFPKPTYDCGLLFDAIAVNKWRANKKCNFSNIEKKIKT